MATQLKIDTVLAQKLAQRKTVWTPVTFENAFPEAGLDAKMIRRLNCFQSRMQSRL
jgi:hypothetical protein